MDKSVRVQVPTFEIVDCPTINLRELREMGRDCPIRNEAMIDSKMVVFAPPTTVGAVFDGFKTIIDLIYKDESHG